MNRFPLVCLDAFLHFDFALYRAVSGSCHNQSAEHDTDGQADKKCDSNFHRLLVSLKPGSNQAFALCGRGSRLRCRGQSVFLGPFSVSFVQ